MMPVVLFGIDFWSGLIDWVREVQVRGGKVSERDLDLLTVTDDIDLVVNSIIDHMRSSAGPYRTLSGRDAPPVP
jgi:predicted Rossmann-fold nucleotide-binding protein